MVSEFGYIVVMIVVLCVVGICAYKLIEKINDDTNIPELLKTLLSYFIFWK